MIFCLHMVSNRINIKHIFDKCTTPLNLHLKEWLSMQYHSMSKCACCQTENLCSGLRPH